MKPPQVILVAEMREAPIAIHRYLQPRPPVVIAQVQNGYNCTVDLARGNDFPVGMLSNTVSTNWPPRARNEAPKGRAPFRKFMR